MKDCKYSIIIPCYNGKPFLKDCFESLANQSFKDFEFIFIDDKSSDGSFEEAQSLSLSLGLRGQIISKPQEVKKGVSASRNLGVQVANGEWLVFLDCDDYFTPDKLAKLDEFVTSHPNSFAIHHAYQKFDNATGETSPIFVDTKVLHDFNFIVQDNPIGTSTVAIKASIIRSLGGFNETLNGIEDYFLWCRIAKHFGAWDYLPELLVKYRFLPDSLMAQRKLTYYIEQAEGFYLAAKQSAEFTDEELVLIYNKLFFSQLSYRVDISLQFHGWKDFFKGLNLLISKNHPKVALFYFKQRTKNYFLFWVDYFFKKLTQRSAFS